MGYRRLLLWGRLVIYGLVVAISIVIIEFTAYFEYLNSWKPVNSYLLPFAIAILSIVVFVPTIVIALWRKKAPLFQPRFELLWTGVLMALWLSAAMYLTIELSRNFGPCSTYRGYVFRWNQRSVESWCKMHYAAEGLLWTGWVLLGLVMASIIAHAVVYTKRGQGEVWVTPLSEFRPQETVTPPSSTFPRRGQRAIRQPTVDDSPAGTASTNDYDAPPGQNRQELEAQIEAYRRGYYQPTPPRSLGDPSLQMPSTSSLGIPTAAAPGSHVIFPSPLGDGASQSQRSLQHLGTTFNLASPPATSHTFPSLSPPSSLPDQRSPAGTPPRQA